MFPCLKLAEMIQFAHFMGNNGICKIPTSLYTGFSGVIEHLFTKGFDIKLKQKKRLGGIEILFTIRVILKSINHSNLHI